MNSTIDILIYEEFKIQKCRITKFLTETHAFA